MKRLDKLELIDKIGRELQSRMTFSEIYSYFETYSIPTNHQPSYNSKYVYVKEVLPKISDDIIQEIANELNIDHPSVSNIPIIKEGEAIFWKPGHFKLFISHLSSFKKTIAVLKSELEKYGISAFVAHEDIEPTKDWQDEIEKGLFSMDALCAILMPGFKESNWTEQEVGVAVGRGVLIIPLRRGLDPYGFIGKYQGFQTLGKNIGQVAEGIFKIISTNSKTKNRYLDILVELFLLSSTLDDGIRRINALQNFENIPEDKIMYINDHIVENKNLKNSILLGEYNRFILKHGLPKRTAKDFEVVKTEEFDDLPF